MQDLVGNENPVRCYGPKMTICRAQFAGAASTAPTLINNLGIKSITQSTTTSGVFTVTLAQKFTDFSPLVKVVGDKTLNHDITYDSIDLVNGTFTFTHFVSASDRTTPASTANNGLATGVTFHIRVEGRGAM